MLRGGLRSLGTSYFQPRCAWFGARAAVGSARFATTSGDSQQQQQQQPKDPFDVDLSKLDSELSKFDKVEKGASLDAKFVGGFREGENNFEDVLDPKNPPRLTARMWALAEEMHSKKRHAAEVALLKEDLGVNDAQLNRHFPGLTQHNFQPRRSTKVFQPSDLDGLNKAPEWQEPGVKQLHRCRFCRKLPPGIHPEEMQITYTNVNLLLHFVNERGMITSKRVNGNCRAHQNHIVDAVKLARQIGFLSYVSDWKPPSLELAMEEAEVKRAAVQLQAMQQLLGVRNEKTGEGFGVTTDELDEEVKRRTADLRAVVDRRLAVADGRKAPPKSAGEPEEIGSDHNFELRGGAVKPPKRIIGGVSKAGARSPKGKSHSDALRIAEAVQKRYVAAAKKTDIELRRKRKDDRDKAAAAANANANGPTPTPPAQQ